MQEKNAVLIDVREPDEYRSLRIPGARLEPLSVLKHLPEDPDKDKPAIFFCRSGRRTEKAGPVLSAREHAQTYIIDGGLMAWEKAGLPVEKSAGPLPIMRQVHIAAGSLIILFTLLGRAAPFFSLLAALIGAGLLYSGFTGKCGMSLLLQQMPWNKKS